MDQDAITRLRRRRELMQIRAARQTEAGRFRELAARLHAAGVRSFSRMPALRVTRLMARYVGLRLIDERVDWSAVDHHGRTAWHSPKERDEAFARAVKRCFEPATRVVLISHTAESGLVASAADVADAGPLLLPLLKDTLWVAPVAAGTALVEVSFLDGDVCWHPRFPTGNADR